ncbi:22048_t:CDS:2, partial [Dentiscutata erythropus]
NIDETPIAFDLPNAVTIDKHSAKTVSIRTTGHEKSNFTMILGCLADGTKLPATCIFKLKNMPVNNFSKISIFVRECSLLVLDSFKGHITNLVKKNFRKNMTDIAVISGGLT